MELDCEVGLEPLDRGQESRDGAGIDREFGETWPAGKCVEAVDQAAEPGDERTRRRERDEMDPGSRPRRTKGAEGGDRTQPIAETGQGPKDDDDGTIRKRACLEWRHRSR